MKAVIFDLWNTLAKKKRGASRPLAAHFGIRFPTSDYEKAIQLRQWEDLDALGAGFLSYFGLPDTPENRQIVGRIVSQEAAHAEVISGVPEMLDRLAYDYSLGLLSNTSNFETLQERWNLKNSFDSELYSFQMGLLKPDRAAFTAAADSLGVSLKDCYFVDDNKENVEAANACGMKGILFTSPDDVVKVIAG